MATKYVYHCYEGLNADGDPFITLSLDDKWFRIPPNEPFEMAQDSNGRKLDDPDFYTFMLLQTYAGIYGLVELEITKTRSGLDMNIDRAHKQASDLLLMNRYRHIDQWAINQIQERVKEGKPVLAPSGFVEESVKVLNMDLYAKYRLQPIGWDWRPDTSRPVDGVPAMNVAPPDVVTQLKAENSDLRDQMDELRGMMAELLARSATPAEPETVSTGRGKKG